MYGDLPARTRTRWTVFLDDVETLRVVEVESAEAVTRLSVVVGADFAELRARFERAKRVRVVFALGETELVVREISPARCTSVVFRGSAREGALATFVYSIPLRLAPEPPAEGGKAA